MLKTEHVKTIRPGKKHAEKFIGLFQIIQKTKDQTYTQDLKNLVGKNHDTFYVEKLEKTSQTQNGHQRYRILWSVNDDEALKYLVDIINSIYSNGNFEYQLLWSDNTN